MSFSLPKTAIAAAFVASAGALMFSGSSAAFGSGAGEETSALAVAPMSVAGVEIIAEDVVAETLDETAPAADDSLAAARAEAAAKAEAAKAAIAATAAREAAPAAAIRPADPVATEAPAKPKRAASLAAQVRDMGAPAALDQELHCLAGAVYFESKGESLNGQLAVAHVVINRAKSGRFPASLCGVVYQRSQFSFVRGGRMPAINTASQDWREAVAIARIAHSGLWESPVGKALFFHATHVSPGWRLTRVARIDNHIFYR